MRSPLSYNPEALGSQPVRRLAKRSMDHVLLNAFCAGYSELLRLRGEVGRLRLQHREIEPSGRDQMQAAQGKLADAEAELARLTKLHSENP